MHEMGLVSSFEQYLDLPLGVIEDVRLLAEGEALKQEREARQRRSR